MTHLPIDPERRRAIDELFDGAVEQPREQRGAWLRARCSDADLRSEVQALLDAYDRPDGLLDRQALAVAAPLLAAPEVERTIGPYRLLRELGRGGMGVVFLAERVDGHYRSRVAVKLLRNSPDADELHRRFLAERQILASLNHPNIAQLLDGGVTEGHLPFLVMEFVDGVPITNYCDRQRLSIDERLHLFHDVCAAVHHAHQNLVIHRDIKPSNILVTEDRRVKLLDFGIAKLLNPMLGPAEQPMTRTEFRVMTPEYASPEQVRGDALTTASDVYALGVVLYELLSGRRPHRITGGSPHELAALIERREPHLPSVAVTRREAARIDSSPSSDPTPEAIAAARGLSVERLRRRLQGDLDAIVMMALRKESGRRYGSADLLWEEVQRHLDGLPVIADHGTRWYRTRKFFGRHRLETIAAAAITVSLIGGASVAMRQAAVANHERARAEQALGQSKEVTDFLVRLFRTPAPAGATREQVTARDMLATGTARIDQLAAQPLVQAQMLDALGRVNEQLGRFDEAEQMLQRALALRRAQQGDHPDVAETLNNLSAVVRQRGRAEDAQRFAREAVAIQERVLGPRHPDVALSLRRMAELTSDAAVAESLVRVAHAIQYAAFGAERMEVTNTNAALADLLISRGAYAEAESILRENLAIRGRIAGPDHPATANSMMLLGNFLLSHRGQPAAAESLFNQALGALRGQPAPDLPNIFAVLSGLIGLASNRGDYARAESIAREALEVQRRVWGPEHPMTIDAYGMIAEQVANQRRYAEAESIQTAALTTMERTLGPEHGRVARVLTARAIVRAAGGRPRDAEPDLRRALAIYERLHGARHRLVGGVNALLADVVARRGDAAAADTLFARAASILRPLPRQRGPEFKHVYAALADHYKARNQASEEEYFRRLSQSP